MSGVKVPREVQLALLVRPGLAAAISVPIWVYLGYFGAHNHEWLAMWIRRGQTGVWLAIVAAVAALGVIWWRKRKTARDC